MPKSKDTEHPLEFVNESTPEEKIETLNGEISKLNLQLMSANQEIDTLKKATVLLKREDGLRLPHAYHAILQGMVAARQFDMSLGKEAIERNMKHAFGLAKLSVKTFDELNK